jgi:hypothetical protein
MTTYDDNLLAVRFAALAPEPLPGDWDDVLDRAGAFRPQRRRLAGGGRRRVLVVALATAALVAAIGTAAYGTVRVLILDQGFIGLPPVGATPSTPESSDLVVEWFAFARPLPPRQDGTDMVRSWVYADGRIIWDRRPRGQEGGRGIPEGANEFNSGYLEQRLSPKGVEFVRAAAATLLDESRALVEEIPAGEDPWWGSHDSGFALVVPDDYVSDWGVVAVPDGDHSARLLWGSHEAGYGNEDSGFESTPATPEQLSALRRVYALLADPASALPSSAWAVREVRAYVPSHYAVCIYTSPPKDAAELLSLLPARAAELLRDKRRTPSAEETTNGVGDCYKVETQDAREVADALAGLVREEGWGTHWLAWRLDEAPDGTQAALNPTDITIEPYFPDGRIAVSGPFG